MIIPIVNQTIHPNSIQKNGVKYEASGFSGRDDKSELLDNNRESREEEAEEEEEEGTVSQQKETIELNSYHYSKIL